MWKNHLRRQRLTFQVAGLSVSESDGQILQALRQRRDHVPQQPLLLLGAVATTRLQGCHGSLAPMEHLKRKAILTTAGDILKCSGSIPKRMLLNFE